MKLLNKEEQKQELKRIRSYREKIADLEELNQCYKENILIVINGIDVEEFSCDGDFVEYVLIRNTRANELILETICIISQSDFNIIENTEGRYINIAPLGFEFGEYWSSGEGFEYKAK